MLVVVATPLDEDAFIPAARGLHTSGCALHFIFCVVNIALGVPPDLRKNLDKFFGAQSNVIRCALPDLISSLRACRGMRNSACSAQGQHQYRLPHYEFFQGAAMARRMAKAKVLDAPRARQFKRVFVILYANLEAIEECSEGILSVDYGGKFPDRSACKNLDSDSLLRDLDKAHLLAFRQRGWVASWRVLQNCFSKYLLPFRHIYLFEKDRKTKMMDGPGFVKDLLEQVKDPFVHSSGTKPLVITLYHSAGTGGSCLARWALWELRTAILCIEVRILDPASIVKYLVQLCGANVGASALCAPVLMLIDRQNLSSETADVHSVVAAVETLIKKHQVEHKMVVPMPTFLYVTRQDNMVLKSVEDRPTGDMITSRMRMYIFDPPFRDCPKYRQASGMGSPTTSELECPCTRADELRLRYTELLQHSKAQHVSEDDDFHEIGFRCFGREYEHHSKLREDLKASLARCSRREIEYIRALAVVYIFTGRSIPSRMLLEMAAETGQFRHFLREAKRVPTLTSDSLTLID